MNNKGFSIVEILGVMVILAILLSVAITEYSKYQRKATEESYDMMAQNAATAAEEYIMDHVNAETVNFDELVEYGYLERTKDADDELHDCIGTVNITNKEKAAGEIDSADLSVSMCCKDYNYTYSFPGANKVEDKDGCRANENVRRLIEKEPEIHCQPGGTKTINYSIYTMDFIDKICNAGTDGKYGTCYDPDNPKTHANQKAYPCRRYHYHQRACHCTYSKATNKFCSSSVDATGDDHTMRVNYLLNTDGIGACNSEAPESINSYVDHVCWYGVYSGNSTVMTFHGYQFFKGQSVGYTDFSPNGSWFHDGGYYDDRVPRGADVNGKPNYEDGCKKTCIHFTEKWMGPVED